jgi:CubicO group peptidase (beta-lactamase class C family)
MSMPWRQLRVLHREFLFRIVDRELLATHAQGDMSKLLLQFAALLIFVSLLFAASVRDLENAPVQQVRILLGVLNSHRLIAATMLVVGLLAVLSWQSMFPDRLDVHVLAPLPVRPKTLLIAKVAAMVTALLVAVLALNLAAGVAWPFGLNIEAPAQTIPALTSDRPLPPVGVADLQAVMDRDLAEAQRSGLLAPGVGGGIAIGVSQRGERRVFAYGASKADSLFEAGSVTKTFTGVLLAHMAGAHQVRIDEPVRELLPELGIAKPERAEISLLDLATHRSGMRGMDQSYRPPDPDNPLADYDKQRLYIFLRSRGLVKWDSNFRYSNIGFGLLGHALATRAGMDYVPLVGKVITGPLSMHDTVFTLNDEQERRFMQPYRVQRGPRHPVRPFDVDVLAGAGGFRSTAGDMLTWAEANLHPDRLSPGVGAGRSALAAALTASHEPRKGDGPGRPMGLAWFFDPATGSYWHGGATPGSTTQVWFSPREDLAIVVLSNTGPGSAFSAEIVSEHIRARLTGKAPIAIADVTVPATGGLPRLLRFAAAWWLTMIAAGTFIFGLVMALQGLAMQLLPRRTFLRASSFLQLGAFAVIVSVYCLQSAAGPPALVAAQLPMIDGGSLLAWSPSFWFLGLFQQLSGSPAFGILATRAWVALGLVLLATATAYGLSYYRTLRRIAEEPVIPPRPRAIRAAGWLPSFGHGLPAAVVQFSVRTLLRSPQHRVILAFYLGMGFAATIFFLSLPRAREIAEQASAATLAAAPMGYPWNEVSGWMIASSVLMMVFSAIGTRLAFALPLDLRANWIFRTTPPHDAREYLTARRRAMLAVGVLPVWTVMAVLLLSVWPWRAALGHLIVLGLLGAIFAEVGLRGAQKIPFTCSYLPGKSSFHVAFWVFLVIAVPVVVWASSFEREVLDDPIRYVVMLAALAVILLAARLWTRQVVTSAEGQPRFEEEASDQVVALNVWDGLRNLPRNGQGDGQRERGGRSAIPSPSTFSGGSPSA